MNALIHLKLEAALLAYFIAYRASDFPGVTAVAGHGNTAPVVPFLAISVQEARPHPDFAAVAGRAFPEITTAAFVLRANATDATFESTARGWLDLLDTMIAHDAGTGTDYARLLAYINAGAAAWAPITAIAIHPAESTDNSDGESWEAILRIELVAQNG